MAGSINLTFNLTVGQVTETVNVQAEAELLKSTDGVISATIDNAKVIELPLNGRNFNNLVRLTPGATRGANGGGPTLNAQTWAVTGSRSDNANYTLDGTYNNGTFFKTAAIAPSIDAINEFKIQTNMSARYGAAAGANINVSIRSGTNEYHGGAYEFLRNSKLDSRNYFAATRPDFKFNQFGFTLGGPIQIPKIYDGKNRTFFFFNYEGFQQRLAVTQNITIPNNAWRSGNLQYNPDGVTPLPPVFDPYTERQTGTDAQGRPIFTRDRFLNNQTSTACLSTCGLIWISGIRLHFSFSFNLNNNNYINSTKQSREDTTRPTLESDHKFSENNSISAAFPLVGHQSAPTAEPAQCQPDHLQQVCRSDHQRHAHIQPDNDLRLTARLSACRSWTGTDAQIHRGLPERGFDQCADELPAIRLSCELQRYRRDRPGNGNLINGPDFTYQGSASMTKIVDKHSLAFGYDYTKLRTIHDSVFLNFGFNSVATYDPQNIAASGHPFASFLLGLPASGDTGRIAGEADLDIDQQLHHLWVQDDIRLTDKFSQSRTPVRIQRLAAPSPRTHGRLRHRNGHLLLDCPNPITGQPANIVNTIAEQEKMNFAPRIGLAYRIFPRTVIRSAYGIFYNSNFGWEWSTGAGTGPSQSPTTPQESIYRALLPRG